MKLLRGRCIERSADEINNTRETICQHIAQGAVVSYFEKVNQFCYIFFEINIAQREAV